MRLKDTARNNWLNVNESKRKPALEENNTFIYYMLTEL